MQIGDILVDPRNNQVYLVKAFMPKYPKRVWLLALDTGIEGSTLKSIARHWIPNTQERT